jgi:hypothetical protein
VKARQLADRRIEADINESPLYLIFEK